ncbi:MAG: DNA topoisomerase 4 subunit A, partial [Clostridia bacterium]|nr:DNA topoisomerase 4 subunit A [Clostridia bacterium]
MDNINEKIFESNLSDVLHGSMMPYAEHVIMDRALPRVEDGLKPVQRRILYTMYEMGLTPDKPHKKCAKIVGDCLGKYHPHGDTSVYDALVRMAQNFNMRMPLISGHGNFGTVDGDGAAAYRYTEARLEQISYELLRDIEKETVNFNLNFDDTLMEPDTLPGRYPNLLVNGAYGIAVGLATNIPTHNLAEVIDGTIAYIDNPKIKIDSLMRHIKGPDFPTGGYIIADEELKKAYLTGKGKIKIRARVNIEKDTGDKKMLVITEIPFQVNKANLLKSIVDLKETKTDITSLIHDVVDESDRNGMRAVVKLKKEADPKKVLAYLYKKTQLEISFGINMVAIASGKPKQMGLLDIISYYVNYQREVVLRRCKFDLERAKERAHILEGLIVAVKNIDKVIKIIKSSDNTAHAKQNLMSEFSLTEVQAQAILDLRLARLTKLEVNKLEEELKQLKITIKELSEIIADKKLQMEVVKKEMLEIKKKYKEPRRSLILLSDGTEVETDEKEEPVIVEDMVFAYTANNMIKKMTEKSFANADRSISEKTTKNEIMSLYVKAKSDETIYAVTNKGNVVKIEMSALSESRYREKGVKLTEITREVSRDEYPVGLFAGKDGELPETEILMVTTLGVAKRINFNKFNLQKQYYSVMNLKDGDTLLTATFYDANPEKFIACITEKGKILFCTNKGLALQDKNAGGSKLMDVAKGDKIIYANVVDDEGEVIVITDNGLYKRVITANLNPVSRGAKGVKIAELSNGAKIVYGG